MWRMVVLFRVQHQKVMFGRCCGSAGVALTGSACPISTLFRETRHGVRVHRQPDNIDVNSRGNARVDGG